MSPQAQVPLDLNFRPALGREDFLLGEGNRDAVKWIDQWPIWPGGGLVIFGPEGSGKSHLVKVWLDRCDGNAVERGELEAVNRTVTALQRPCFAIEDLDGSFDEEGLLHFFNQVMARDGSLLLTSRVAPRNWGMELRDLSSRILALPTVEIHQADDELLEAVLRKLFSDRQILLRDDVVSYLISRIDRSFGSVLRIAAALDSASLASQRAITVPMVREFLEQGVEKGRTS